MDAAYARMRSALLVAEFDEVPLGCPLTTDALVSAAGKPTPSAHKVFQLVRAIATKAYLSPRDFRMMPAAMLGWPLNSPAHKDAFAQRVAEFLEDEDAILRERSAWVLQQLLPNLVYSVVDTGLLQGPQLFEAFQRLCNSKQPHSSDYSQLSVDDCISAVYLNGSELIVCSFDEALVSRFIPFAMVLLQKMYGMVQSQGKPHGKPRW